MSHLSHNTLHIIRATSSNIPLVERPLYIPDNYGELDVVPFDTKESWFSGILTFLKNLWNKSNSADSPDFSASARHDVSSRNSEEETESTPNSWYRAILTLFKDFRDQATPPHDTSHPPISHENAVIHNNAPTNTLTDQEIQILINTTRKVGLITLVDVSILRSQSTEAGKAEVQKFIDYIMVTKLMAELPDIEDITSNIPNTDKCDEVD